MRVPYHVEISLLPRSDNTIPSQDGRGHDERPKATPAITMNMIISAPGEIASAQLSLLMATEGRLAWTMLNCSASTLRDPGAFLN